MKETTHAHEAVLEASRPNGIGYMDGRYMPREELALPMTDIGFKLCDMTYDAVHVRNGAFFRLDEVFMASTAGGIMPINRIDDRPIGGGSPGPVTRRLSDAYWAMHDEPGMSSPVNYEP